MTISLESSAARSTSKVRVLRDIAYVAGDAVGPKQRLDLYLPEASSARVPVVISAPGGGLVEGDKASDAFIGQRLAAAGFAVAVINYRLSPEVSHPAHVEDLAAAVEWVHRSIADLGGDPEQLFVIGHSAGVGRAHRCVPTRPRRAQPVVSPHCVDAEVFEGWVAGDEW